MSKDKVALIPLTSIASSTLDGTFKVINSTGLPQACYMVRITNAASTTTLISTNTSAAQEVVINGEYIDLVAQNNSGPTNQKAYWPVGTKFYASATAGTGTVYLSGYYNN